MKVIYKYPVDLVDGLQEIEVPITANYPRSVIMQDGKIVMYVEHTVTPEGEQIERHKAYVFVVGTGHKFDDPTGFNQYVGTVQDGGFVWHVFYRNW